MVAIWCVPVPVMVVVHVIVVLDLVVPAVWAMHVLMRWVRHVRQRVLVVVTLVRRMRVPFVHVVGVPFALHAGVPAAGPVVMLVLGMHVVFARCHDSSLLC
jgi:hypothetical protein